MPTPALDRLFIAYNTGAGGRILHTICIVRKYFTTASNALFASFPVKKYPKEPFRGSLRVNFCGRAAGTPTISRRGGREGDFANMGLIAASLV